MEREDNQPSNEVYSTGVMTNPELFYLRRLANITYKWHLNRILLEDKPYEPDYKWGYHFISRCLFGTRRMLTDLDCIKEANITMQIVQMTMDQARLL